MAKPELGTKRLCAGCGVKFYDLSKTPPVCPSCGTVFEIVVPVSRARPDTAARAAAAAAAARTAEAEAPEPAEAELISLEDADEEATGKKKVAGADDVDAADDVETDDDAADDEDDTFIEQEEDEDTDVAEIIGGDIENEEET